MKPSLPLFATTSTMAYENPNVIYPIKHAFDEQMVQYCLMKLLSRDKNASNNIDCAYILQVKSDLKYGSGRMNYPAISLGHGATIIKSKSSLFMSFLILHCMPLCLNK